MSGNFIACVEVVPSTTNETNILYVVNPPTNTSQLSGILLSGTSLENSVGITFRVYINPTVSSNGTSLSPISRNFLDGKISSINLYSSPIVTTKGTKISTFSVTASTSKDLNTSDWYLFHGQSFLITAQENTNNKGLAVNFAWSE